MLGSEGQADQREREREYIGLWEIIIQFNYFIHSMGTCKEMSIYELVTGIIIMSKHPVI